MYVLVNTMRYKNQCVITNKKYNNNIATNLRTQPVKKSLFITEMKSYVSLYPLEQSQEIKTRDNRTEFINKLINSIK